MQPGQCRRGVAVADHGADGQPLLGIVEGGKLRDASDVDQRLEQPVLLGDPQPDIGGAGDEHRIGMRGIDFGQLVARARGETLLLAMRQMQHLAIVERRKPRGRARLHSRVRRRRGAGIQPGLDDRPVAGAAAEIAGEPILDALPARRARLPASRHRAA